MKKLGIAILGIVVLLGMAAALIYNTEAGQDAVFQRLASAVLNRSAQPPPEGLRVVVCGSASPLGNDPARAQACIAVVTPEHFLLFDVGSRSPMRIAEAALPMNRLSGVFLTHFHSDHIAALPDVNLTTWIRGRKSSLPVYGPQGIDSVISGFNQAYLLDRQYRSAHHGDTLLPPSAGPMQAVEIATDGIAWQDDLLTVTAFSVEHAPIHPAVGYRIDYRGRSVVISGDSNASDSLFAAAQGADLLLHDALARPLLDPMIAAATAANTPVMPTIMNDVIDYHADSTTLEERATQAGIQQLALYHLVPVPMNPLALKLFRRGLSPDTIITKDLQTFDFPTNSKEIIISHP